MKREKNQYSMGSSHGCKTDEKTSHSVLHRPHRFDPRPNMPHDQDILDIATVTINTLKEIGIGECCFIGGMACKLYTYAHSFSEGRQPNVRH